MSSSDIKIPSDKKFGFFFTFVFALIGILFLNKELFLISYLLFLTSLIFLLISIINAKILLPLNKLWMRFGMLIGMIVSPIVLGIIFFGLFTPIALYMKIIGRDELNLKLSKKASYWKERDLDYMETDAFKNQF